MSIQTKDAQDSGIVVRSRIRPGLTLIETTMVVATITFATSIIVPSLSRSREGGYSSVCMNNLKLFGQAIQQYVADNSGYLPGPIHCGAYYQSGRYYTGNAAPQPLGETFYRLQLTYLLQPYLNVSGAGEKSADELAFCPTADGITTAGNQGLPWYWKPRSYYVCNSVSSSSSRNYTGYLPYYGTTQKYYFGHTNVSSDPYNVPLEQMPKRLDSIANISKEWAMADLWYSVYQASRMPTRLAGTWPYMLTDPSTASTVVNNGQLRVPSYAFHLTPRTYSSTIPTSGSSGDPRNTAGSTNVVYFDAHAASVRPWIGTVNPCLTPSCGN